MALSSDCHRNPCRHVPSGRAYLALAASASCKRALREVSCCWSDAECAWLLRSVRSCIEAAEEIQQALSSWHLHACKHVCMHVG